MSLLSATRPQIEAPDPGFDLWPHQLFWHGAPRAFVTFSVRVPRGEPGQGHGKDSWTKWRERGCRVEQLDRWLPINQPHLRRDAYASINCFSEYRRSLENLVRLSATFIDIDCGRSEEDCSAEEAAEMILDLVSRGLLPHLSMLQFSGRGLWAFWLLRDDQDPGLSPLADPHNRKLWRAVQSRAGDALVSGFPGLAIDRGALDATRMTRLNGSINPRSGRRVRYELLADPEGDPVRHTLDDLARFFGLPIPRRTLREPLPESRRDFALEEHRRRQDERAAVHERRQGSREGVDATLSSYGRRGHIVLWQGRIEFLDRARIEVYGGLIPNGHRFHMLSAYAYCHAKLMKDPAALEAKIFEICRRCCVEVPDGPISDSVLRGIAKHARAWADSGQQIRNRRLAEFAGLDPVNDRERIERLGLNLQIGPKGRDELARRRRGMARKIFETALASGETPPSARRLASKLTEAGCETGHATAHILLRELLHDVQLVAGPLRAVRASARPIP